MGEHLTIEERYNSNAEINEIKDKLKKLRLQRKELGYLISRKYAKESRSINIKKHQEISEEIAKLQDRKKRLVNFRRFLRSNNGFGSEHGVCYTMFGKKRKDLTPRESAEYNRIMKQKSRGLLKDKEEILRLRFEEQYPYSKIMEHFNGKYLYADLKKIIDEVENEKK